MTTSRYGLLHFPQLKYTINAPTSHNIVQAVIGAVWSSLLTLFRLVLICVKNHITSHHEAPTRMVIELQNMQTAWLSSEHPPYADQPETRFNRSFNISMGTRTQGSVWSIFRHKYSRRSLLGFLLQKHSEMICEKSGLAFPWFFFFHSAHKEPFNIAFKRHFPDNNNQIYLTRWVGWSWWKQTRHCLSERAEITRRMRHSEIISKYLQIMTRKETFSRKRPENAGKSTDKEQKHGIDLAPRFSCDSLVVVAFPPRPWVPDRWSRHCWWCRERCHKTGDGPCIPTCATVQQ